MPRLWNETIDAHRREVREAILGAAAALVAEGGLRAVTMSRIAERAGIGRATLYKYFSDVEAILSSWHERQITHHLQHLTQVRDRTGDADERLEAVLSAYALMVRRSRAGHDADIAAHLHQGPHIAQAHDHLHGLIRDLLSEGAANGSLRTDIAPDELAVYCLHALSAASSLPSEAAVRRLVDLTLAGLRNSD
ncbi:TetR/AcrR family transcriptional regulator [Streptomyces sp. ISL-66]|uniref:TetR/AcrR family transcriptional regulator n=1 Tax=Streptomyces sp. ISL-66 TaxID=2819186 RepID=UPI001BE5F1A2|nr:TetR/AcrR family transcriptional regulator [Streptomyces sp. ISL-66]MBT2469021.1 TetR/AcrR family transcriptional regulator [Streptomyces sp. ISL-66]